MTAGRQRRTTGALVLALVVLPALVAGCGSGSSRSSRAPTTTTVPALLRNVPEPIADIAYLLQDELTRLGYHVGHLDSGFTARATRAIEEFQRSKGLPANGAFDQATAVALRTATGRQQPTIVRGLQTVLTELGYYHGTIDGNYGPATTAAVRALQRDRHVDTPNTGDVAATLVAMVDAWRSKHLLAPTVAAPPDESGLLQAGDTGPAVTQVQQRLTTLGYRPGPADGVFGAQTTGAGTAFEKHEGLPRDGVVGSAVRARLRSPTGAGPRSTSPQPHIEVDLDRQIAFVVVPGQPVTILDVSTGSGRSYTEPGSSAQQVAYTPTGPYTVYRAVAAPVVAPLGTLYKPLYFLQGWAMHGEAIVPPYPGSHGCVRTHDWDQDWLFPQVPVGTPITIYGTNPGGATRPANAGAGY
ncbi:MAG TPA: L,D-transpeptidase family protein [Acidimicrobiia bacterium]|nr:L,D-transpeptidase family protein [Acidimicrobiia bacterium]